MAERRYVKAVQDLKMKELQIQDHHKKDQEMQIKLVLIYYIKRIYANYVSFVMVIDNMHN